MEKEITLKEIKGPAVAGYYFTVTDRAPKEDEWSYPTAGAAVVVRTSVKTPVPSRP